MAANQLVFDGNARHLLAVHEAGHAVAYLLLGIHVPEVSFTVQGLGGGTETVSGRTRSSGINTTVLALLVSTAAAEAAARHWLTRKNHPLAAELALDSAQHDHASARLLMSETSLPAGIGMLIADILIGQHQDAVAGVANALLAAPGYRLTGPAVVAAADLGATEVGWHQLQQLAREAMPSDEAVEAYLNGQGHHDERARDFFLDQLRTHAILHTPTTAPRRAIEEEIYERGLPALEQALSDAIWTASGTNAAQQR
ncbi:hypothetical protein [Streptomyces mirabilis]|uniref:hypothetical protein n=1 Tax=Streptomyces mirabilis TaxID=68239 RepID=UPI0036C6F9C3